MSKHDLNFLYVLTALQRSLGSGISHRPFFIDGESKAQGSYVMGVLSLPLATDGGVITSP